MQLFIFLNLVEREERRLKDSSNSTIDNYLNVESRRGVRFEIFWCRFWRVMCEISIFMGKQTQLINDYQ